SPNGPFAVSIALNMHTDSSGCGISQSYYATADRARTVVETELVQPGGDSFNFTYVAVSVQSVQLVASPANTPLDANPNLGGGLRIFPDKLTPTDPVFRRYVHVIAKVSSPIPGLSVVFKRFDVDDPSDDPYIDPNGSRGNDNRDPLPGDADVHTTALTDASGF